MTRLYKERGRRLIRIRAKQLDRVYEVLCDSSVSERYKVTRLYKERGRIRGGDL